MNTASTQTDIIARVKLVMEREGLNQAQLARKLQLDPSNVSKYLSGRLAISDVFMNRVIVALNVDADWLKHGTGSSHQRHIDNLNLLPLYDIDVAAGIAARDRAYTDEVVEGHVVLPGFNPNWVMLRARGDSMEPVVMDNALLAVLPQDESESPTWGQIYVVVTNDRRVVKYVRRHNDNSLVVLKSANRDYDPIEIDRNSIIALYPVKAIVNIKMCK